MSKTTDADGEFEIEFEIDGRTVEARPGETILEAADRVGIDIPTLCALEGLTNVGACRMCLVEVDGERLETACTTAAEEGMSVAMDTEALWDRRRTILELLFAEENHYCMYCEAEGDCELEDMFNRAGLDASRFPLEYPDRSVDTSSEWITMDLDRCINCGRCIRTCEEVVANDTLSFAGRGKETTIVADDDVPLADSSCIECGACVQACPTGALYGSASAYRGRTAECETVETTCTECSMGCALEVDTNSGRIVRIEGARDGEDGAQLCERGRFELLADGRERVDAASIHGEGAVDLEVALERASEALADADSVGAVASDRLPTETLVAFAEAMAAYDAEVAVPGTERVATEARIAERVAGELGTTASALRADGPEAVLGADAVVAFDTTIVDTHPIAAAYVRRAAKDGATLVGVDEDEDRFGSKSDVSIASGPAMRGVAARAVQLFEDGAEAFTDDRAGPLLQVVPALEDGTGVIVLGPGVDDEETIIDAYALAGMTDGVVLSLPDRANAAADGLIDTTVADTVDAAPDVAYLLAADDEGTDLDRLLPVARAADTVIVQATRESTLTRAADVVLPALDWFEREGTVTDASRAEGELTRVLEPRGPVDEDRAVLDALADPGEAPDEEVIEA